MEFLNTKDAEYDFHILHLVLALERKAVGWQRAVGEWICWLGRSFVTWLSLVPVV